jgi:hypothetical protein
MLCTEVFSKLHEIEPSIEGIFNMPRGTNSFLLKRNTVTTKALADKAHATSSTMRKGCDHGVDLPPTAKLPLGTESSMSIVRSPDSQSATSQAVNALLTVTPLLRFQILCRFQLVLASRSVEVSK